MENIKFIKEITNYVDMNRQIIGNCIYFILNDTIRAKAYCYDSGVHIDIIDKTDGKIDNIDLPFKNYFSDKQCSKNAPKWSQHIDNGEWHFSRYEWCLPSVRDYQRMADGIEQYLKIFE